MLVEGYLELTSGCTDCLLSNAVFSAVTNVGGTGYSISFFTANTLTDVPTTELWGDTITDLISGATGVGNVVLDSDNNTITVNTSCEDTTIPLANQNLTIQLKIVYDINCVSC
jgi:type 1 fimbria pilin